MCDRDLIYEELKRAGLPPILNYSSDRHPNIGSIVRADAAIGFGEISIGTWRIANPSFTVSLVYGFYVVVDTARRIKGAGHGTALAIKPPNEQPERFYRWSCGNVGVDQIGMPKQALIDFGLNKVENRAQYFHYPDLMWFNPYPNEVMEKDALLAEIERRLRSVK